MVNEIQSALSMQFHIGLPLFIPPVLVIFLIGKKVNSLPALWAGIFSAILFGLFSGQCGFHELLQASYYGFQSQTGNELLDNLLSKGGMDSVYYGTVICFIIMAMSGVLEEAGFTEVIAKATVGKVKKSANLIGLTLLTSFFVNFVMADQYISLVLPGRMLAEEYKRRGLAPKVLANALESGGTVTSCLVPWSTCGVFMATTFGIATVEYAPYVLMGILSPIVLYILSLLHLKIAYVQESAHL
uniref:Na+/H+ antiporter NhaC family protein n=1 Tax=Ndongobacter massiliensis TaxID=1871025 RepID=UPI0009F80C9C|nr:Na+/H+ antiporter NhaC family protein [Ndongobacter massiliensis]